MAAIADALRLDREVATRALVLALSAWVAFAIAATQHVHNAYWAAMPVWVVAQASRGMLLERAVFRIVGTLLGAAAGFAILHVPLAPHGQLALLALWVALNAGLTHLLRGVHGYGALLAGTTAAVVVIPSLLAPEDFMALAVARVECTLIGVVVVTVITGLFTPQSPRRQLYARARKAAADALAHAAALLDGAGEEASCEASLEAESRRIVGEISQIEAAAPLTLAGSLEGYRRLHDIDALAVGVLSLMSAALAFAQAKRDEPDAAPDTEAGDLAGRLRTIAAELRAAKAPSRGLAESPVPSPAPGQRATAHIPDVPGLGRLTEALNRLLDADDALRHPARRRPGQGLRPRLSGLAPHREWPLAARTGLAAGAATFIATAIAYAAGWQPLVLGALGVSMFALVLGSLPLPQNIAPTLLGGVVLGVLTATLYRFTVQPGIDSTAMLLLTLAPFLLVGGILRASPRTALLALDANMCFLLASQAGAPAAASAAVVIADGGILVAAAGLVAGSFILLPRNVVRQAENAVDLIRRDLRRMAAAPAASASADWNARTSRQILRLALHLGRAEQLAAQWPTGLLAVLNLGHAIARLHRLALPAADAPLTPPDAADATHAADATLCAAVLDRLPALVDAPEATARAVHELAAAASDPALRRVLRALARSLAESAELLRFAAAPTHAGAK